MSCPTITFTITKTGADASEAYRKALELGRRGAASWCPVISGGKCSKARKNPAAVEFVGGTAVEGGQIQATFRLTFQCVGPPGCLAAPLGLFRPREETIEMDERDLGKGLSINLGEE